MSKSPLDLINALKNLLVGRNANTQEDLCNALEKQGYEINQTKVSRLLRKIGAVKIVNSQGEVVYSLPREPSPPTINTSLRELILEVSANEAMVVIFTSPGSASMLGRVLDYQQASLGILGTLAGDDTLFVAPKSVKEIPRLVEKIKKIFEM